jgi:hypothetical protein
MRKPICAWLVTGLVTAVLSLGFSAHAALSVYHFSGVIDTIGWSDGSITVAPELANLFQTGGTWSMDFVYNTGAADVSPQNPNLGFYQSGGSTLSFNYGNGAYTGNLSGSQLNVIIYDWLPGTPGSPDGFSALGVVRNAAPGSQTINFPNIAGLRLLAVGVELDDNSSTVFSNDGLPGMLNLQNFDEREFFLQLGTTDNGPFFSVDGTVTSVAVVPEPSVSALLLLAVASFVFVRCRNCRLRFWSFS